MTQHRTYVIGKDGQIVYDNVDFKPEDKDFTMQDIPILAVDKAKSVAREHTKITDYAKGARIIRDFDITFTIGDGETKVATVRMNENAVRAFHEELGRKLDDNQIK